MASNYYYPTSKNGIQKTLAAQLLNTASTGDAITFSDVDGVENKPGVLVINRVDANGADTPSAREFISHSGTSGNTVLIETRNVDGSGAVRTHAINSIVEFVADAVWAQRIIDQALVAHDVDGTHKANLAFTTPTLTSPVLNTGVSGTAIKNENDMVSNSATALATQQSIKAYVDTHNIDGWTADTDTWVYVSASSFKVTGKDVTNKFTKGTRLKFTQTTVKYAVVVASAFSTDTTVTIAVNTDYEIANAAITVPYYSYQNGPTGYPVFFNWTPTYSASGSMTYTSVTKVFAIYNISASGLLTGQFKFYGTTGGTASTFIKFTYPVAKSSTIDDYAAVGSCSTELNAGSAGVIQYEVSSSSLVIRLYNSANYSLSGSQYNTGTFHYFI